MSFLTGYCDFLDLFTITGGRLSKSKIYIENTLLDLRTLEDCLPFLMSPLRSSINLNGCHTYFFANESTLDIDDRCCAEAWGVGKEGQDIPSWIEISDDSVINDISSVHFVANDCIRANYYHFLIDAGVAQDIAFEYAFCNRDKDYLMSIIAEQKASVRESLYRGMKFYFGCDDYKSFSKLFNKLNEK